MGIEEWDFAQEFSRAVKMGIEEWDFVYPNRWFACFPLLINLIIKYHSNTREGLHEKSHK